MAPAVGKPKPPPYPRPVPHISAEEIEPRAEDERFYANLEKLSELGTGFEQHDYEDAEAYAERRAAKRMRIEKNAQAYLRGQHIEIQSARLKGSFVGEWRNPWSRRGDRRQPNQTSVPVEKGNVVRKAKFETPNANTTIDKRRTVMAARERWLYQKSLSKDERHHNQGKIDGDLNQEKIGRWLKTSDVLTERHETIPSQDSPTPAGRVIQGVQVPRSFDEESSQEVALDRISTTYERIQQMSRNMNEILQADTKLGQVKSMHQDKRSLGAEQNQRPGNAPSADKKSQSLASQRPCGSLPQEPGELKDKIKKANRRSEGTNPTSCTKGFEQGDDPKEGSRVQLNAPRASVTICNKSSKGELRRLSTGRSSLDTGPAQVNHSSNPNMTLVLSHPSLRGRDSNANSGHDRIDLPSAQEVPMLQPEPSSSSFGPHLVNIASIDLPDKTEQSFHIIAPIQDLVQHAADASTSATYQTTVATHDTTQNIASITISKEAKSDQLHIASSATATKKRTDKKRKRASFAVGVQSPDQMQRSVRRMTRVRVGKASSNPPNFSVVKDKSVADDSDQENISSHPIQTCSVPNSESSTYKPTKGILRSTNPVSSQNSNKVNRNSGSISQQQDGQGDKFLEEVGRAVVDEADFDLEAAIDDLGSFLGSWDAEKAASGLIA